MNCCEAAERIVVKIGTDARLSRRRDKPTWHEIYDDANTHRYKTSIYW